ncbi:MAG: ribonuclease PH [Candidatus Dormiibacterota bacterium]
MPRHDGRAPDQLRDLTIATALGGWAEGEALITLGSTRVLCTATVEERVPPHRRGTRAGWVTAEYAMLPRATPERTQRERNRVDGRSQEIQRLVARSLRAAVDLRRLGERTVIVDCDVLQADGGTRTASITGGFVALGIACRKLVEAGLVNGDPVRRQVAAVSVGVLEGEALLDLDYREDSRADTDMNLVMTQDLQLVEIQGTAEGVALEAEMLAPLLRLGEAGVLMVLEAQRAALADA